MRDRDGEQRLQFKKTDVASLLHMETSATEIPSKIKSVYRLMWRHCGNVELEFGQVFKVRSILFINNWKQRTWFLFYTDKDFKFSWRLKISS